jgi:hypothetical protein
MKGTIDDSQIVQTFLELIIIFSETQLEKIINSTSCTTNSIIMTTNHNSNEKIILKQNITIFFEKLVSITILTLDPSVFFIIYFIIIFY